MSADREESWDGGYIRYDANGRRTYWIRRQIDGRRYEVSTRCHTSKAAHEHLQRFEADPAGYTPGGDSEQRVVLDEDLAEQFLTWSRDVKKNSRKWLGEQRLYLAWWAEQLDGRDLRRVQLAEHILPTLDGDPTRGIAPATARPQRIAVLKRLYSWLVSERHLIRPEEDPTYRALKVPQARPEQWLRMKAIAKDDYLKVREKLSGHWLDATDVLAGTGWHVSELVRFVRSGAIEAHPTDATQKVLVCPHTKGGELLKTAVSEAVAVAAGRLRARGSFDPAKFADALRKASGKAKLKEPITPGRFRHSVATWAINAGAAPAAVAAFLGHKSPRTTKKFYATPCGAGEGADPGLGRCACGLATHKG